MQAVIDLLRNEETRALVLDAVRTQDNQITSFVTVLVRDLTTKTDDKARKQPPAISIIDGQCKP